MSCPCVSYLHHHLICQDGLCFSKSLYDRKGLNGKSCQHSKQGLWEVEWKLIAFVEACQIYARQNGTSSLLGQRERIGHVSS